MINLKSKVVLITGGSRGIGASCVKYFSIANASVAFTYNNSYSDAQKLVKRYSKLTNCRAYKVNLQNENEIQECVEKVIKDFGRIDILVNNAGIWKEGKIDKMNLEDWNETIKINLTSVFLFTKLVVPFMKRKRFGRIINISSTAGQRGEARYSHYAASKGGIISFTKSLADELGEYNILVNCVAPGWVWTDMSIPALSDKERLNKEIQKIPLKKIPAPDDIAGPVLFLASDLAKHITGEVINVNGGSVMCG
ncbi:MAG: 3-oxoacyl-ACP reductase FabG [Ignavibacterium sp.]|nr:3-oxoacyl-ACP reductase FabG [Ignavibacterium sp.]MCX7612235.1 3-oxoacyl-ACP reductase FabG [Ignavibacterium sp.]MDW8374324.1 3-oxoacyl-ACP reductase family protein [Ignavibacteriales bacterium]